MRCANFVLSLKWVKQNNNRHAFTLQFTSCQHRPAGSALVSATAISSSRSEPINKITYNNNNRSFRLINYYFESNFLSTPPVKTIRRVHYIHTILQQQLYEFIPYREI